MFSHKSRLTVGLAVVALAGVVVTPACQTRPASTLLTNPTRPARAVLTDEPSAAPAPTFQVVGTVVSPNQASITFRGSGRITKLHVQEGATVKQGDPLAVLDTTDLEWTVRQAQAALDGAQARLRQAKSPGTDADLAAAQAALDAAQTAYDTVRAGPTADQIAQLKALADNAQAVLDQARAAYDRVGGASNPSIAMTSQSAALQQATNNYKAATAAFGTAVTHPTLAELAAAKSQIRQAQAALARLQPAADNIATAQAQVDQAQAALALAQQQVANATLTAPVNGTVTWLGPHVGETVGPTTPILTLADLTRLQLQGVFDQVLLGQIQIGQKVTIVPDAFKDGAVTGRVSRIGWQATATAGVTSLFVTIDIDPSTVPLRPGLSATAQINTQAP